ncbi:hypothetical protein Trydic_g14564 [Trypoxylus dichotomus]
MGTTAGRKMEIEKSLYVVRAFVSGKRKWNGSVEIVPNPLTYRKRIPLKIVTVSGIKEGKVTRRGKDSQRKSTPSSAARKTPMTTKLMDDLLLFAENGDALRKKNSQMLIQDTGEAGK